MRYKGFIAGFVLLLVSFAFSGLFAEVSVADKRRDVIKYGLEGEITELVQSLQTEKDTAYTEDLRSLFEKTRSVTVRKGILALFADQKIDALKAYSLEILADPYDTSKELVNQILAYVTALEMRDAAPSVRKMIESDNADFRDQAIRTLGKIGSAEDAQYLVDYMDAEIPGDEKQRLIIRQNVMAALGDMKAVAIRDKLVVIVKDSDENVMIRASAALALGKMENIEDVPLLASLYEEQDPILRGASITALSNMRTADSIAVILESFKDSYYKVRLEALSAAGKLKITEAIPYILYRAKTDPVDVVKMKSFEALGSFNDAESNKWLLSVVCDEKNIDSVRAKAADVLVTSGCSFDFAEFEKAVLITLKDDKKTKLRYEFGKILVKQEDNKTAALASAFISHKDTLTRSIGLDMYAKNKYMSLTADVKAIAADEKQGALQRRAKKILGLD